jgi:Transposase DDE domain
LVAYVRTVKTTSAATAVQIVWSTRRGSRKIEHLGSAHDDAGVAALKAAAAQRLAAGQAQLDLGLVERSADEPLPITSSKSAHLWEALCTAYEHLGFAEAADADEAFRQLVLARIIEPTSKADSLRVIEETGIEPVSYPTLNRRLPVFAKPSFRQSLSSACDRHARLGPASLVLYDVTTLHFETDAGDGFRVPGFSKERRLDPQITLGLLTDASGFPLTVAAFEGNKAETATMVPVINAFKTAHQLSDVTVVADAGMISEANQIALQAAGLSYILGARIPYLPDVVREWRDKHPDEAVPDGLVLTQPWPSTSSEKARGIPDRVIHYQYRHHRARRTLRGIDEQVAKAQRAVDGHAPVKRNRYIQLCGATKSVNRTLEARPGRRPDGRATPPTSPPSLRSSSSMPTTSSGASRRPSGCPSTTCRPGPSTTAPATPSKLTSASCSPQWRYPIGLSTKLVGASRNSSGQRGATAPSPSRPASTHSPPPSPHHPTSPKPSPRSTDRRALTRRLQTRSRST